MIEKLFLDQNGAADLLNKLGLPIKPSTLATKACRGGGPAFHRFGKRRLYTPDELRAWADAVLGAPVRSATEARANKAAKAEPPKPTNQLQARKPSGGSPVDGAAA
jgi:hypothetical protein